MLEAAESRIKMDQVEIASAAPPIKKPPGEMEILIAHIFCQPPRSHGQCPSFAAFFIQITEMRL